VHFLVHAGKSPSWDLTVRSFSVGVGTHVLGLCTNGVFDRFPDVKLAYLAFKLVADFRIGHSGEHIVADLVRCDAWLVNSLHLR
jgi:2,3-dihydroxybenzoate decarboxylase